MSNVEQGIMKFEVGGSVNKDYKFELQDRLVDFAVRVIPSPNRCQIPELENILPHNSSLWNFARAELWRSAKCGIA